MPTVLIAPPVLQRKPGEHTRLLEAAGFEIRYPEPGGRQMTHEDLLANLAGIDASLAGPEPYSAEILERFPQLRVISRAGVGYDAVDLQAALARRIPVGFTPGTNHDAVAEHAMALMLGISRRLVENHQMVASGKFVRRIMQPLRGKTLGILGFGRIGRAVATRALAFGLNVVAFDPLAETIPNKPETIAWLSLPELYACSDYITLHLPLTEETRKIVGPASLSQMKDGVVIINTARGGLVDEDALSAALVSGKVSAAGLDVFENEPPVGSPMLTAPNVLLSPHVAAMDTEAVAQMAVMAARTIIDLHEGRWPSERLVNAMELGDWKWDK